jgi:uncharacterized protein YcnI
MAARSFSARAVGKDVGMRRLIVLVAVFVAIASPALAHVEVSPESAPKGGSGTFTFNVEDERDRANQVTVEIYLPDGVTAPNITPTAPAGWEFTFTAEPSVRFTHAAPGPQGDQSFTLAIGQLPDTDNLVFKTVVTYDDGTVDRWIDVPAGADEPPHPAAVVKLTGTAPTPTTRESKSTAAPTTVPRPDKGSNGAGIAGVIIAAVVVVGGLVFFATRGRKS